MQVQVFGFTNKELFCCLIMSVNTVGQRCMPDNKLTR